MVFVDFDVHCHLDDCNFVLSYHRNSMDALLGRLGSPEGQLGDWLETNRWMAFKLTHYFLETLTV